MADAGGLSARDRRVALEQLNRDRLIEISDLFELDVGDRRVVANHIDTIIRSRRVDFPEVLGSLSRDELKAICEALGLDSGGREKQALIDRILANEPAAEPQDEPELSRRSASKAAKNNDKEQAALDLENGQKLTRERLEKYLWSAADILRGAIDSSDYKNYIFGLLFLKRLSDRFQEECEVLVKEGADPEDQDEHQFFVPPRARWSQIQKSATNLGEVLNKASAALEEQNTSLEGVLAG
ncbi:MAG: type I restriction-modification system subunit M N-terminal domain-containing protein, partial [Acidobacteriota bacterium]